MVCQWILAPLNSIHLVLIVFTLVICLTYQCVLKNWWYFSKRNVKFVRGLPVIGNYELFFGDKPFATALSDMCNKFRGEQLFGIYMFSKPTYVVRDPELVKKITISDFDNFTNHSLHMDVDMDSLLPRTLTFMRDQQWKEMRSILSPAFTGNKMRMMFDLVRECSFEFMHALSTINGGKYIDNDIEIKDLLSRYTTNIIATCAFGFKVDALTDSENELFLSGRKIAKIGRKEGLKLMLFESVPTIMKAFGIKFFDTKLLDYFRGLICNVINYREKNDVVRPDMVHLLMQAKKGTLTDDDDVGSAKKTNFGDDDLVAQCLTFFFGGFETVSTVLCFMINELACNEDIQCRLRDEIIATEEEIDGKPITYEVLQKMKYLDMVVSETLRVWPPNASTDRLVSKSISIKLDNGTLLDLTTNDGIFIPIYAIHMDPEIWPNPKHFDPERFSDENRKNIHAGAYIPFGSGQRMCIAMRFALMVLKCACYFVMKDYDIAKCSKTQYPIELSKDQINPLAKGGFWVRFQPRLDQR